MKRAIPILCALGVGLGSGCAGSHSKRARTVVATPVPTTPPIVSHSDGKVVPGADGPLYLDSSAGFDASAPAGWTATTHFAGTPDGPPAEGDLRVRFSDGEGCIVDIAAESLPADDAAMQAAIARGREVFFFARIDEPRPQLPAGIVRASTALPPDPSRVDLGYWIDRPGTTTLRVEGRFASERMADCKESLDAIVRAIAPHRTNTADTGAQSLINRK